MTSAVPLSAQAPSPEVVLAETILKAKETFRVSKAKEIRTANVVHVFVLDKIKREETKTTESFFSEREDEVELPSGEKVRFLKAHVLPPKEAQEMVDFLSEILSGEHHTGVMQHVPTHYVEVFAQGDSERRIKPLFACTISIPDYNLVFPYNHELGMESMSFLNKLPTLKNLLQPPTTKGNPR